VSGFDLIGPMQGPGPQRTRLLGEPGGDAPVTGGGETASAPFANALTDAIEQISELRDEVAEKAEGIAMGKPVELHDLMISMGKSEVAFNLMLEVRNKIVDAWERLSRSVV